jgi:ligand-binding sensor domain-containing protein/serine phosphatase RsbU (regulator of sigma subunit)
MKFHRFYWLLFVFIISCTNDHEHPPSSTFTPALVHVKEYQVPKDSTTEPRVILSGKPRIVPAGKPAVVAANTNILKSISSTLFPAGKPAICVPGQGIFKLPQVSKAIDLPSTAGTGEVVIAKDAQTKDINPKSFSTFKTLQGLKHNNIRCMLQDKSGNLWFGTWGGGVSKYDGKYFTHYTKKEGLSSDFIWSMLEDKDGNIWFGTWGGGACKYDGYSFTHYGKKEGLSSDYVICLLEDKSKNIWLGTEGGGVNKYDGKSFANYTQEQGLIQNIVLCMLEDKYGSIWFGTRGGVSKYDGKAFFNYTKNEGLSQNVILSMCQDSKGNFWFGTEGRGVCKFDGNAFSSYADKDGLSNNFVVSVLEDKNKNMWFSTWGGGLNKYDGESFTHYTEKEGLSNNFVVSSLQDRSGNLWFGTEGWGVNKFCGQHFTHFTDKDGLSNNGVLSILRDDKGNLWFGTNGGGVCKYDGNSFTRYTTSEGLSSNIIASILQDKEGNIWFGTVGAGVCKFDGKSFTNYTDKEGLSHNIVYCMLQDKLGNIWFGTNSMGACKFDGTHFTHYTSNEGLSNNIIVSMLQDRKGNIWFGTYGGGVCKYDGHSFSHITEKEGLSNNFVLSTLQDHNGNLWFGTEGGGVCKYDGVILANYTEKENLCNNYVYSLLEDKAGSIWFGTRNGISRLKKGVLETLAKYENESDKNVSNAKNIRSQSKLIFKSFSYEDGFLGVSCFRNSISEDGAGNIWIGAADRLTCCHRDGDIPDTLAPSIQLTDVQLFNERIPWKSLISSPHQGIADPPKQGAKDTSLTLSNGLIAGAFKFNGIARWYPVPIGLSLSHSNNNITFQFIGVSQNQTEKIKYQYMLVGLDENWSAVTSSTTAAYGSIPPGTYTFKVRSMNSEGYWSSVYSYPFSIRPPWWKTIWFRLLAGVLIVGSVVGYFQFRISALRKRQRQLEETVKERTVEVVHQKDEAEKQRAIAEEQRAEAEHQKELVQEQKREIIDSITYAKRLQQAILPSDEEIKKQLPESFLFYKPKDIVAGDFYWMERLDHILFIAAADSTGHGVPGAMVSVVCCNALNRAVKEFALRDPGKILDKTRDLVLETFAKSASEIKDGMDISLLAIDTHKKTALWSGANNHLWYIEHNEMKELTPDKQPIGKTYNPVPFTTHSIHFTSPTTFYLLTDGYPDQFGGPKGKKFKYKPLEEMLLSTCNMTLEEQHKILSGAFEDWKGNLEQVDDVTIIGVRF